MLMLIGARKYLTKMGEEVCSSDCIQPWRQLHKTGNQELNDVQMEQYCFIVSLYS